MNSTNEIVFFNLDIKDCFINEKFGISAIADKKYIIRNRKIILFWIKDFVQIVIPVLALLIAYISLTTKFDSLKMESDKELQEVKDIMLEQKERHGTIITKKENAEVINKEILLMAETIK